MGYLHCEGLACWLMGECLAPEAPADAENYVETAMRILEKVGARDDLAKAMITRAALRQGGRDLATARRLLNQAYATFRALGTPGEPARVEAAIVGLDRGSPSAPPGAVPSDQNPSTAEAAHLERGNQLRQTRMQRLY